MLRAASCASYSRRRLRETLHLTLRGLNDELAARGVTVLHNAQCFRAYVEYWLVVARYSSRWQTHGAEVVASASQREVPCPPVLPKLAQPSLPPR